MATRLLVAAALGHHGMTPAQVHARLPLWSIGTIRHALRELKRDGAVVTSGKVCRYRYMRAH